MPQPCIAVGSVAVVLHCGVPLHQTVLGQTSVAAPCNATCINDTSYHAGAQHSHGQVICSIDCAMPPYTSQKTAQGWSHTLQP